MIPPSDRGVRTRSLENENLNPLFDSPLGICTRDRKDPSPSLTTAIESPLDKVEYLSYSNDLSSLLGRVRETSFPSIVDVLTTPESIETSSSGVGDST